MLDKKSVAQWVGWKVGRTADLLDKRSVVLWVEWKEVTLAVKRGW